MPPVFSVTELEQRVERPKDEPDWSCWLVTAVSNRPDTKWGSYEGGFASWSHDFDVVCKRSFGRRLMPHILLDDGIDKERSIMRVSFECAFEQSKKVGRHMHGLLRIQHKGMNKSLRLDYQAINRDIDKQLGRRIRLHFRLIKCKPEFVTSLNGVREYITKQKMRAQEAKEADG